jgi:prephenate dehydratase
MRLALLGDLTTFAGQAGVAARTVWPQLTEVVYFDTVDKVWDAVPTGRADAALVTAETTHGGWSPAIYRLLSANDDLGVLGEIVVPYRCHLLGKPGATLAQITVVLGHGSVRQCQAFLTAELPSAVVHVHAQNSSKATEDVLRGDGTAAVVATLAAAESRGLAVLAADIDAGSEAAWWLVGRRRGHSERVDRAVITSASCYSELIDLAVRLSTLGLRCRGVAEFPTSQLFQRTFIAVFEAVSEVELCKLTDMVPASARLLGAFSAAGIQSD